MLSDWVLIFTSLPESSLDTKSIAELYRVRWQVELVIKRLKSLSDIDRLRARKDSKLADLYLHGKLLFAAVTQKIAQRRFGRAATTMVGDSSITHWRLCVFTLRPGTITNDFFVNLLDMSTQWRKLATEGIYEVRDRTTNPVKWAAMPEAYVSDDAKDEFVEDFVNAWAKEMDLNRFDIRCPT